MEAVKSFESIRSFESVVSNKHDYARDWKAKTVGKAVGYLCTYVPEELLYAAGVLPVRVIGAHDPADQDIVEPYLWNLQCSYTRDILSQGLHQRYSYLDGLVAAPGCYQLADAFGVWKVHIPLYYSHTFAMPRSERTQGALTFVTKELKHFKASLEDWLGISISEEALARAIEVYNTNRRLMKRVYEEKKNSLAISGADTMKMVLASQVMDKGEHNRLLKQLLAELGQAPSRRKVRARLMLVGSEMDDVILYEGIEKLGADVVIDDTCVGTRYFWDEVAPQPDLLKAVGQRYLDRVPCPWYDYESPGKRASHILRLAKEYDVQGVVLAQLKFCDGHMFDMPEIQALLKEHGIPTLLLETELVTAEAMLRNRVEAFLEMLE